VILDRLATLLDFPQEWISPQRQRCGPFFVLKLGTIRATPSVKKLFSRFLYSSLILNHFFTSLRDRIVGHRMVARQGVITAYKLVLFLGKPVS
jgi:hypothetical protein